MQAIEKNVFGCLTGERQFDPPAGPDEQMKSRLAQASLFLEQTKTNNFE